MSEMSIVPTDGGLAAGVPSRNGRTGAAPSRPNDSDVAMRRRRLEPGTVHQGGLPAPAGNGAGSCLSA